MLQWDLPNLPNLDQVNGIVRKLHITCHSFEIQVIKIKIFILTDESFKEKSKHYEKSKNTTSRYAIEQ